MTHEHNPSPQFKRVKRSSHLSSEHMEAMLRPSAYRAQAGRHLDGCESCREEVDGFSEMLLRFRSASILYAEREQKRSGLDRTPRPARQAAVLARWPIAGGALACGVTLFIMFHLMSPSVHSKNPFTATVPSLTQTFQPSDEALLESVQNDLSTSVPAPLQLLAASSTADFNSAGSEPAKASVPASPQH